MSTPEERWEGLSDEAKRMAREEGRIPPEEMEGWTVDPDAPKLAGAICCLCGEAGEFGEMLGLTMFPTNDVESWQQWYIHGRCVRERSARPRWGTSGMRSPRCCVTSSKKVSLGG